MSSPLIWIILPMVFSLLLWFVRNKKTWVTLSATGFCLLLSVLAIIAPIGSIIKFGPWTFEISAQLVLFGRRFILGDGDRTLLTFIYAVAGFWFFGAGAASVSRQFTPLALGIVSLAVAALAVEPFLYAALIAEVAVLFSLPLLAPPGKPAGQGVARYLIYQTLAMAFILLAGWAAGGVEANPANQILLAETVILLGLGFAFWLAVFPFHTWIPLLMSEVQPYQAGFILVIFPLIAMLLALDFLNAFAWLRQYPLLPNALRLAGGITVAVGGIWAAFQKSLSRLYGYFVVSEIGFSLLTLSLSSHIGYLVFVASFLPRVLALAVWALAMSALSGEMNMDFDSLKGLLRKKPIISISILFSAFSLSGFPLFAGYPVRQVLLENLSQQSLLTMIWVAVGMAGLLIGVLRTLLLLISSHERTWQVKEAWQPSVLLAIGSSTLLIIGIVPFWFFPSLYKLLDAFSQLI
jgi:NADH-quinone oxidoreductase subunit N